MILDILLYLILKREGVYDMAIVYALLIVKGRKVYSDVPAKLRDKVLEVLTDMEVPELAVE